MDWGRRCQGGAFEDGAITGAYSRLFNDLAHAARVAPYVVPLAVYDGPLPVGDLVAGEVIIGAGVLGGTAAGDAIYAWWMSEGAKSGVADGRIKGHTKRGLNQSISRNDGRGVSP